MAADGPPSGLKLAPPRDACFTETHWKRELSTVAPLSESAIGEGCLRLVDY